jgi:hypothetical protein
MATAATVRPLIQRPLGRSRLKRSARGAFAALSYGKPISLLASSTLRPHIW